MLNACVDVSSLEKIFFASTAAVYPIYDLPIDESLLPAPSDIYGLSKYAGEELVKKFYLETKVPSIICRFFNAFGPNETNPHLIPEIQKQILNGHRVIKLGNTEPKRDFIHTTDMALAVEALLARFSSGVDTFNLGQGIEYSVMEVMLSFEEALGEKLTIEQDPARLRKSDRLHLVASIEKLKQFTGWQPTISLQKGIQTLLEE